MVMREEEGRDVNIPTEGLQPGSSMPPQGGQHVGHAHFWERALSRRAAIKTTAGGAAVMLGSGILNPVLARADADTDVNPRPIPETIPGTPFHILLPGQGEPATITDFNGFVGITEIQGTGSGGLLFDADVRFMQGLYVGVDGKKHHGTFSFI